MIRTLRSNNDTFANFSGVVLQPASTTSLSYMLQHQTTTAQDTMSPGVLPAHQAIVPTPALLHSANGVQFISKPSISSLVSHLTTNSRFVFPLGHLNHVTHIVPTHALTLDVGMIYDPRLTQGFITTNTKFQPYEQLTGIAHERPELVMLTDFQPLFDNDVSHTAPHFINYFEEAGYYSHMTDAGRYLDAQAMMRNLQVYNWQAMLRDVSNRYIQMNQIFQDRAAMLGRALQKMKGNVSFLLNLVRIIETQKRQLDLRHDLYIVNTQNIVDHLIQNYAQFRRTATPSLAMNYATRIAASHFTPTYNCTDTLVRLGYTPDNVNNVFSSTKIWLQLLQETKSIMQHHSLQLLDIDPTYQRQDNNATTILKPPIKYFSLAENLPALPNLDELKNLQISNVSKTINDILQAFNSLYQNVYLKNEEARIAGLARLLSQEFRYSRALSTQHVKDTLLKYYGFQVAPAGNQSVFDAIFGRFGNNITDFPASTDSSLASVGQLNEGPIGVLPFEGKYVEGDTGILTPGGDWFFDQILDVGTANTGSMSNSTLKFNTTNIDEFSTLLKTQFDQLAVIVDSMNLLSLESHPDRRTFGVTKENNDSFLGTQNEVVWELGAKLLNYRDGTTLSSVLNDRLGAIFTQARRDNRIKTILFLYILGRLSRPYNLKVPFFSADINNDNTPVVDYLIEQLVQALSITVPESRSTLQLVAHRVFDHELNTASLTTDTIRHALKSGTTLTQIIEEFMGHVLTEFKIRTQAISGDRTVYSGMLDTVVMMIAFDLAISMVARYSNQHLVGVYRGLTSFSFGQTTFAVSRTSINNHASFSEVNQRGYDDLSIQRQCLLTIMNVLHKVNGSFKGISNYLNSVETVNKLREIASIVNNDMNLLRMMFSEQQIMLLASTVENLETANVYGGMYVAGHERSAVDGSIHGDEQSAQKITLLDESAVPPAMLDAIFGYFSAADYASQRGLNKKILTIGIPCGFSQRLKQKVNIRNQKRASFETKRNDIVQIVVYKVDMHNPDIVFKPIKYLFELTRFPTRFTTHHWLPIKHRPSLNDIINAIPTQCFAQNPDAGTASSISSGIEYASTAIAESDGVKGARAAFDDPSYSFLTSQQKAEILHNHISSQLLEYYIKLMTGINVAEYNFHVTEVPPPMETEFVKTLTEHTFAHVAEHVSVQNASTFHRDDRVWDGGVLFSTTVNKPMVPLRGTLAGRAASHPLLANAAGIAGNVSDAAQFRFVQSSNPTVKSLDQHAPQQSLDASLASLSHRHMPLALNHVRNLTNLAHSVTSLSDVDAIIKRVMTPKQFDRVFNIMIDPRDFDIDVEKTIATPYGRTALELMLRHGEIVSNEAGSSNVLNAYLSKYHALATEPVLEGRGFISGQALANINNFKFRERDKSQGDLVCDKYFVTIETFGEDEV